MVDSINNLMTTNSNEINLKKQQNINFRAVSTNSLECSPNKDTVEKKGMSKGAKWAIGLGLTALASYGIYALTKGRVKAPKPTPNPENPIPEIKEMAINVFKKDGRFEKGKAILADGTKYTGNITSTGKDGSKVVMEYVDGVLQKSTKTAKDGTKDFEKIYELNDKKEKLVKIIKKDKTEIVNLTEKVNVIKEQQAKIKNLLENNESLSVEELKKQADCIQYKSNKQVEEINNLVETKKNQELQRAEKEAQRIAKEAEEKAKREAQSKASEVEKAEKEAQRIAKEAEEKAKREAQRIAHEVEMRKWGMNYADENMKKLDELFLTDEKLVFEHPETGELINFENLVKKYDKPLDAIYHGTTKESKTKILQEGFRQDVPVTHGNRDGVGGTYFSLAEKKGYGDSIIKAKFNGNIAEVDTETIEYILKNYMRKKTGVAPKWNQNASDFGDRMLIRDEVINRYLQNKIKEMGYQGIVTKYSAAAACPYFSALDPKLITILN